MFPKLSDYRNEHGTPTFKEGRVLFPAGTETCDGQ